MSDVYEDKDYGRIDSFRLKDCKQIIGVWTHNKREFVVWKKHDDDLYGWYFNSDKVYDGWLFDECRQEVSDLIRSSDPIWSPTNSVVEIKSVGCHCSTFDITWIGHNTDCSEKKRR